MVSAPETTEPPKVAEATRYAAESARMLDSLRWRLYRESGDHSWVEERGKVVRLALDRLLQDYGFVL